LELPMIVFSARYHIDIGLHVFPTDKYRRVHDRLIETGVCRASEVVEPDPASWDDLALVHTTDYLDKLRTGAMAIQDIAQLELPWSPPMVEGFRLMVGGTIRAACHACGAEVGSKKLAAGSTDEAKVGKAERVAVHIGGGLHHAFPNHGEGFCPFNDVAVAVRVLQRRGLERAAIVDLDVHHGNGTAFIFESDPRVFTFSMHQQHNYPMWKPRGSLDIGLADGAHDATYLAALEGALPAVMAHAPDCVFYLAGADPFEDDQLGGLRLSKDGLRARDRLVFDAVRHASTPLVVVLAGGYARRIEDTVAIHAATVEEALRG
jgi:acetoin utilization deacetylase AcuC-like enzyme